MENAELAAYADPRLDQYFLVSPEKLRILLDAAEIRPTDRVVEYGAGAGTVARHIPPCRSLTLVEFDERLIPVLRRNVPHAQVIRADAVAVARSLPCDVLLGNLPNAVTMSLIPLFPELNFRTAVLAVCADDDLTMLASAFEVAELTHITGDDFVPPQPSVSRLVRVTPRLAS